MHTLRCSLVFSLALAACGDDTKKQPGEAPLPKAPQILPSELSGYITFPLTESTEESTWSLELLNGGQDDLEITHVALAPRNDTTVFSLNNAEAFTVPSKESATVEIHFAPTARGVYQAQLLIDSNAENFPSIVFEVVGPAGQKPLSTSPDLALFEESSEVITLPGAAAPYAYARYFNLGAGMLSVTRYEITGGGSDAFSIPGDVAQPSSACSAAACGAGTLPEDCTPVRIGSGNFVVVPIAFGGSSGTTARFRITSTDAAHCPAEIDLSGG